MRDVFTTVLRYKLWFDLWGTRQRTIQAVMTIAIGAFAVGTILSALRGVQADTNESWSTMSAPSILLRITPRGDDDLIDSLRNRPELTAVDAQMEQSISWRTSDAEPWQAANLVARDDFTDQQLNLLLLQDGAWPSGRGVAVERHFGMELGDQIEIKLGNETFDVPVQGVIYNRAGFAADLGGDVTIYTTRKRFAELTGQDGFTTLYAAIPTMPSDESVAITTKLQQDLALQGFTTIPAAFNQAPVVEPHQTWYEDLIAGIGFVMQVVGAITMALSLLLIYTTVMAIITQQTGQIGELKAIGASSRQIVYMYLLLVGAFGVMAAIVSLPASIIGSNVLRFVLVRRLGMDPALFRIAWGPLLLQLLLCVFAPVLIALHPILRGARITVREAISSYGLSSTGNRIDEILARMVGLSRVVSMAISNAFRSSTRLVLTQLALGGAGVTLVAVMSTQATLAHTSGGLMSSIYPYQVQLDTEQPTSIAKLNQGLQAEGVENVELWHTQNVVMELADGQSRTLKLNGLPIPSQAYQPKLYAGRWLEPGDTYSLTLVESLATQLGVEVGDTVTIKIPSASGQKIWASEHEWTVVGIVLEPYLRSLSRFGFAPIDTMIQESQLGLKATRVQLQVPAANGADAALIADSLRTFYDEHGVNMQTVANETVYDRSTMEASNLNVIALLLVAIAVIMAAVGGVALSGVLQISVLERRREIGVLRAIGATPKVIRTLFVIEALILGWLSCLIALLCSYPVGLFLSRTLASTIGISIEYQFSWLAVLIWFVLASVIGVFASLAPAQEAINASVQESLAYE